MIYLCGIPPLSGAQAQRQAQHKAADTLLRRALWEEYALGDAQIHLLRDGNGKPFLEGYPKIHFNISHCKRAAAVAVHSQPVGIDVEQIRPHPVRVRRRVLSMDEQAFIDAQPESGRDAAFFRLWTLKESFVKYIGLGMRYPLRDAVFRIAPGGAIGGSGPGCAYRQIEFDSGLILSLCIGAAPEPPLSSAAEKLAFDLDSGIPCRLPLWGQP